ncbi:MAG: phenylacetate--CoA ligase family protein [Myxococcales bacterium]|nr:phenylacetate--CoA ligase family protein [Myxococcales bacterium]
MSVYNDTIYPRLPVSVQNIACTAMGFLLYRNRFNAHFHKTLANWEKSVHDPIEKLHELQRQRLDRLLDRARRFVPYYRDLPPSSDARDPVVALEETLASIPPLEKRFYRDQPEAFFARDIQRSRLHRGRTSGTTGTALPLWYLPETLAEEYATVWRLRRSCGVENPAASNLTFTGNITVPFGQTKPPFWRYNAFSGQHLFSIYHMTPMNLRSYVEEVHRVTARYVQGYPSSIHLVARALLEAGRPLPKGRLAAVFTSSESLLAFQRETIEKAFGAPIRDRYGVSEFGASMTECSKGRLHVDMEFCIVEVDVTEESDLWETGPLLITGLSDGATPLFRYRIGDVGTRSKRPCPCGRAGDVFFEVDGRVEDYVLTPDGRLVGRLDHVFKQQLEVAEAQILQDDKNSIDVLIIPRESYTDVSARRLLKEIRSRLGEEIEIRIRRVTNIPREPNGKFRAVKSSVGRITA